MIKECRRCGAAFATTSRKITLCAQCRKITKICTKCGEKFVTSSDSFSLCRRCREAAKRTVKVDGRALVLRPCHDCGRMITNYRCPSCWEKWKRKYGIVSTVSDE